MIDSVISDLKEQFQGTINQLTRELGKIRTGRANVMMLDSVRIDYNGTPTPLKHVATMKVVDSRLITVQPWEKQLIGDIERAISSAGLGLNPSNDGILVRVPIPPLTGDRRQELVKQAKRMGEDHKIALRNQRRDSNDFVKSLQKEGELTEDEMHKAFNAINGLTEKYTKSIEEAVEKKEAEILEV